MRKLSSFARIAVAAGAVALITAGTTLPSDAATPKGWMVTPATFGLMYGNADPASLSSVRAWEAATWCRIQPSPQTDMNAELATTLGPQLDQQLANGATTAIVGLGHPAPWVFDNTPKAGRSAKEYACGDNAAGVSIPNSASLKPNKDGSLSVQGQRFADYAGAVINFVNNRYGSNLNVMLQIWNEPNLTSGLDVSRKVPGAAWTIKDAVNSLYAYEKIASDIVKYTGNPAITLSSTSMFQKPNEFFTRYLSKQNTKPVVSSLSFNVYAANAKTPYGMQAEWNKRVGIIQSQISKRSKLRRLPAYITETNLNLVNNNYDKTNLQPSITNAGTQMQLATATQMDAFYHGFSSVYWLAGPQSQAAVLIQTNPATVATQSLGVLRTSILGRTVQSCKTISKVRTCVFRDPSGATADLKVLWRTRGSSSVRARGNSTVIQMSGETTTVGGGNRIPVSTTPIVVKPA